MERPRSQAADRRRSPNRSNSVVSLWIAVQPLPMR
jgi:hypothetical protein